MLWRTAVKLATRGRRQAAAAAAGRGSNVGASHPTQTLVVRVAKLKSAPGSLPGTQGGGAPRRLGAGVDSSRQ